MLGKYINKLKDKYLNKHYAVFVDEKGRQREIITVNNSNKSFEYDNKLYVKNIKEYSNLHITTNKLFFFTRHHNYFFYVYNYSEPINFTKEKLHYAKNNKPYIAEDIQSILNTKALKSLNTPDNNFFGNFTPKQIMIGLGGLALAIYIINNGGLQ